MNPLPPLNGQGMDPNMMGAIQALIQNTAAIANNLGVMARNSAGPGEHVPVVGPLEGDKRRVFCHACSMAAQTYVYPCQASSEVGAQFPSEWVRDAVGDLMDDPFVEAVNTAVRVARAGVMDTPESSIESSRLRQIIALLTP